MQGRCVDRWQRVIRAIGSSLWKSREERKVTVG